MIDINLIRTNRDLVKENIKKKFQDKKLPLVDEIYDMDIKYRRIKTEADEARNKVNNLSKEIGSLMRDKKIDEANATVFSPFRKTLYGVEPGNNTFYICFGRITVYYGKYRKLGRICAERFIEDIR